MRREARLLLCYGIAMTLPLAALFHAPLPAFAAGVFAIGSLLLSIDPPRRRGR